MTTADNRIDIVLTCCRDEEDIIATFIHFYLEAGFDAVHVIDNGSTDRTPAIVEALGAEGLPVTLEHDPRLGYERYLTEWFRRTGERFALRWLFFLDCDEFILFPRPLKSYFGSLPQSVNRLRLRQKEVYPFPYQGEPRPPFLLSRRIERHFNDTTKDVVQYDPCAWVCAGKHRIDLPATCTLSPEDIFIRHYKYRSLAQARRKERNRNEHKRTYCDTDLEAMSAFGLERSKAWIQYCREVYAAELWRESFREDVDAVEDHVMANWAIGFLERHGAWMEKRSP